MDNDIKINDDIILSGKNGNGFKMIISNENPHLGGNYIGEYVYNGVTYNGDGNSITLEMWRYLIDKFKIKTILDVGCGCGYSSLIFKDMGCDVKCFDGLDYNILNCDKSLEAFVHDITESPYNDGKEYDLVWCCEVAEHIEEKYLDNFISTIQNGKVVAITAAKPGDGGHHHVNLQQHDYWIEKMEENGLYKYDDELTKKCRELSIPMDPRWEAHFKRNGLIFIKK